jgi:hypothetical protein
MTESNEQIISERIEHNRVRDLRRVEAQTQADLSLAEERLRNAQVRAEAIRSTTEIHGEEFLQESQRQADATVNSAQIRVEILANALVALAIQQPQKRRLQNGM